MVLLAINWAEVGVKAAQFVLSFSIIVVLHELGHFIPARWFKCRVEKFYLFFNPWFSLWKKKVGETEWGIGWIPFGGDVKISGMIDESMDKEQLKQPPKPYEFRAKPAWQRLIIMVGGVVVNLILGFLIYAMMLWHWGDEYVPTNKMTYGIAADSLAESIGLRDGDKLLTIDGKYIDKFRKIPLEVILKNAKTFQVERGGQNVNVAIPSDFGSKLIRFKDIGFITPRVPSQVDTVLPKTMADTIGLRKGDIIVGVDSAKTFYFDEFRSEIVKKKNKNVILTVLRGNDSLKLNAKISAEGKLGFAGVSEFDIFEKKHIKYSLIESLPGSWNRSIETLENYWLQLKLIFSGKVKTSESL
ncbi:MAG TPA: site-2 protease family protein, partial [Chitinophagaceae bacterium]|nr:site-2 protease family protein [Chitinophagaceae bacterium]